MALQAATPAIIAVFNAYSARSYELGVASCADVVVARLGVGDFAGAGETVVACRGWLDGIAADIAGGREG